MQYLDFPEVLELVSLWQMAEVTQMLASHSRGLGANEGYLMVMGPLDLNFNK